VGFFRFAVPALANRVQSFLGTFNGDARDQPAVFETLFREKVGPFVLRLALGLVCVYHGYAKIMANGGTNWSPGLPVGWQLVIAWGEFCGGLAILVGLYCRWAAAAVFLLTIGSLAWLQGTQLFSQPLASLEPRFLQVLCSLTLVFLGGGSWAVTASVGGKALKKR
jgi:putative oxidoreductase